MFTDSHMREGGPNLGCFPVGLGGGGVAHHPNLPSPDYAWTVLHTGIFIQTYLNVSAWPEQKAMRVFTNMFWR